MADSPVAAGRPGGIWIGPGQLPRDRTAGHQHGAPEVHLAASRRSHFCGKFVYPYTLSGLSSLLVVVRAPAADEHCALNN
jgi:hypothetical protein